MMMKDDEKFITQVADSQSRQQSIRRWRRSRTYSYIAFGCSFLAAIASLAGGLAALCGLLSGIAAVNFAVVVSTDLKIKVALLTGELKKI